MNKGYSSDKISGLQKHQTLQPLGQGRHGFDSSPIKVMSPIDAISYIPEVTSTAKVIDLAGHLAQIGDIIWFDAGVLSGSEVSVIAITASSITLGNPQAAAITAADTFRITRPKMVAGDLNGNMSITPGPTQFVLDGVNTIVTEDTVTPANNTPLPVKLTGITGDINVTANDLNVQTSHLGANADSSRIGDGVNEVSVSGDNELFVIDQGAHVFLDSIDVKVDDLSTSALQILGNADLSAINTKITAKWGDLGQKASAGSAPVVLSTEQEAKIDLISKEVTAAAILAKIIVAPATEAKQDDIITALGLLTGTLSTVDVISPFLLSSSPIPSSAALPLEIIAATSAAMVKIQTIEDVGEYIGLYTGLAAAEVLVAILPIAGGEVDVSIPLGTRLSIRHMKATAINTATYFSANLIG